MAGRLARYLATPLPAIMAMPIIEATRWYPIACRMAIEERGGDAA